MMLRPSKVQDFWGSSVLNYRRQIGAFMMHLNDDVQDHLCYRPYPWPVKDLDDVSFLRAKFSDLDVFSGSNNQFLLGLGVGYKF